MRRCFYCYLPLEEEGDYHQKCSRKLFGYPEPPLIEFGLEDIERMAAEELGRSISVTGVQPKMSLEEEQINGRDRRFTVVGLWGRYILKPPVKRFYQMPELEDLTMHLAEIVNIKTAEHALIKLKSGETAYISKRFDRTAAGKLAQEDLAQITGVLTERKYKSSMEKAAAAVRSYSDYPGNDVLRFYELLLFCFITGNADMHLKNFSLLTNEEGETMLSPAYDLISTKLLIPEDTEETALTLRGKKSRFIKKDFLSFAEHLEIPGKAAERVHRRFDEKLEEMMKFIEISFLDRGMKEEYKKLIEKRAEIVLSSAF